ncbi:MAG TPA: DUF92 domain-containing protein [Candidatus Tumulicola sp.]|jgi:uncharacterized protein (TIGR00297 family)
MLWGIVFAAAVAAGAWRARALTPDGAVAAWLVGSATFGAGGWPAAVVLFAFFIPSALLSRIGSARKHALADAGKHGPRDARQVFANGGVAAVCALLASHGGAVFAAAFAGAFAAAAADTWATEIGVLSPQRPRSILTLRPVATGLSGGISAAGTGASIAGAAVVALCASATGVAPFAPVVLAGIAGSLADSAIGAALQALRWCPQCERACETNPHVCGSPTYLHRGIAWMDNDAVNLAATLGGASIAGLLFLATGG